MKSKRICTLMAAVLVCTLSAARAAAVIEPQSRRSAEDEFDAILTVEISGKPSIEEAEAGDRPDDQAADEMAKKKKKKKKKKKSRAS